MPYIQKGAQKVKLLQSKKKKKLYLLVLGIFCTPNGFLKSPTIH